MIMMMEPEQSGSSITAPPGDNRDEPSKVSDNSDITIIATAITSELPSSSESIISGGGENPQNAQSDKENEADDKASDEDKTEVVEQARGAKRVRFSICEYITETLVQDHWNGAHANQSFENDDNMERSPSNSSLVDVENGGSKIRNIRGKERRDSVHPLVASTQVGRDNAWDVDVPNAEKEDTPPGVPWSEMTTKQRVLTVLTGVGKFVALLGLLYFFVCSLDLLSLGFRLIGGRTAGEIFRQSSVLQNPVVGVMIGILTTVFVQSSSTSTSIIVGMVAAGFMDVRIAIPPIMGANIGTSITNTIVSFTQAGDRSQFRRAFAAATVLDMFNWITVIVLLPIEVLFGYLEHVSRATVDLILPDTESGSEIQILSVITNPFVDLIVQLNDTVLDCWANPNCTDADGASLLKEYCKTARTSISIHERVVDVNGNEILNIQDVAIQDDLQKCDFLFAGTSMSDAAVGAIILVSSLLVLCFCLVMIVKLLNSVLKGHVSTVIKRTLNADIPYVPWITGYIAILIGAIMTFLVQSSSVFTSALTPLVGLGVISLSRVYPLTLGANIGTTTTAILASMTAKGAALHPSIQIALCHFFFNITGVLLFYPVPFLRFPIHMAKVLGNTTAKYRWFAVFYLVSMFGVLPVIFIALSLAGSIYVIVLVGIVGVIAVVVAILTILQRKVPKILPVRMRDWKWLPRPLRSLQPYDDLLSKCPCCKGKVQYTTEEDSDDEDGFRKPSIYKSNDFVFLSGNKIPPPQDRMKEDEQYQECMRPALRIVPTRVIRNIGNGVNYDGVDNHSLTNGSNNGVSRRITSPDDSPPMNHNSLPPPYVSIEPQNEGRSTIPLPAPVSPGPQSPESPTSFDSSFSEGEEGGSNGGRDNKKSSLTYNSSVESVLV